MSETGVEYGLCERIADKVQKNELITKELNEVAKLEADNAFLNLENEAYRWLIRRFVSDDNETRQSIGTLRCSHRRR